MSYAECLKDRSLAGWWKPFQVAIRRDAGMVVKPEAEQIDGKVYLFRYGWEIESDNTRYPGEHSWVPDDSNYPDDGPVWIASGDLKETA